MQDKEVVSCSWRSQINLTMIPLVKVPVSLSVINLLSLLVIFKFLLNVPDIFVATSFLY